VCKGKIINVRRIQTSINLIKKSATNSFAQTLPASSGKVPNAMFIDNPVLNSYVKRIKNELRIHDADGSYLQGLQELNLKLAGVKDKFIQETIYDQLNLAKRDSSRFDLDIPLEMLDVYHTSQNHYSMVDWGAQNFYKYLKAEVCPETAKAVVKKDGVFDGYSSLKKSFEKARKLEALKIFCGRNGKTNKQITDYMYETYYLPKLSPEAKAVCKKISNEFGTKLFLEHNHNHKAASVIYKEFSQWKQAGGADAKFPDIFDCSRVQKDFIDNESPLAAFFRPAGDNYEKSMICVENDSSGFIERSIRHEMTHLNDKKMLHNGERVVGYIKERVGKRPYEEEFKNACVPDIDYAYMNKSEFLARASQGDYSKYSDHFKKVLVRLGMPEWEFNMKPVKDMDYFG